MPGGVSLSDDDRAPQYPSHITIEMDAHTETELHICWYKIIDFAVVLIRGLLRVRGSVRPTGVRHHASSGVLRERERYPRSIMIVAMVVICVLS